MLNAQLIDEWCYVVLLNSMLTFAIARFGMVSSPLFGIHFSIHQSAVSMAKDHR
jgi:hypothetical protein